MTRLADPPPQSINPPAAHHAGASWRSCTVLFPVLVHARPPRAPSIRARAGFSRLAWALLC